MQQTRLAVALPPFQTGAALPQRIGGVLQTERNRAVLLRQAIQRLHPLELGGQPQARLQCPAIAQTAGRLGGRAIHGIAHTIFAEHVAIFEIVEIQTKDRGVLLLTQLRQAEGTIKTGCQLMAGIQATTLTELISPAEGKHAIGRVPHVLFVLGIQVDA